MPQIQRKVGLPTPTGKIAVTGPQDARTGLGYGIVEPRFHLNRELGKSYPYREPDNHDVDDIEIDDDSFDAVRKKSLNYKSSDSKSAAKSDPFYFVAGSTKLSDCFWRIDDVLKEIAAFSDSMSPIPQMNKGKGPSMTGYGPAFTPTGSGGSNYRRTGSLQGWSKSPPPLKVEPENENDELDEEGDIYSLLDLAKKGHGDVHFAI